MLLASKLAQSVLDHQTTMDLKQQQEIETKRENLTLDTKKELRNKMVDFNSKIKQENKAEKTKLVQNIIDTHQEKYDKVKSHVKSEMKSQEDIFAQKMA